MAIGKAHVLPSGPWVAMNEPQLYLPPMPRQALGGRGGSGIGTGEDMRGAVLAEGGVWLMAFLLSHFSGHW